MNPIIVLGEDWGRHPSSTQHLVKELGKKHPVTWVNSIGLRSPKLNLKDIKRVFEKIKNTFFSKKVKSAHQEKETTWSPDVVNPWVIPYHDNPFVRKINALLLRWKISRSPNLTPDKKPILWVSLPTALPLLNTMDEMFSIYYCGDDFSTLAGVDHDMVTRLERELVEKVDLIIVASEKLKNKFPENKTLYLPHGVADHFFNGELQRPADLPPGPVAGFYGSLSSWIDQELIYHAALELKHWAFVFIGPVCCDISRLQSLKNVHFLGEKTHEELPDYAKYWQVSLLPFKDNGQIRACNPLKLREYMAMGTAIVSTEFPAAKAYEDWLTFSDYNNFAKDIELAAAELNHRDFSMIKNITSWQQVTNIAARPLQRSEQVCGDTWRARALLIENYIVEADSRPE